ncbi:MAG: dihydroorotate dehydrogenase-like protein [Deltaproteobacteria bacterium]|jgi:dihydroorotate dehydrogenase (fumarate)|nr:dihydroorotate dehydrogenase-like protein [Deltaproteobacteria bacterium]
MTDLSTRYMGLDLKNPIVVSSCGLTKALQGIQNCAAAQPGAIVLKSLFEEQIVAETAALTAESVHATHTETIDYLEGYGRLLGPREYLQLIRDAKKTVSVPIIASINCVTHERWADYAKQLESAGADGLEINIGFLPNDSSENSTMVEERYERILHAVRTHVSLPLALKVGPYISSFAHLAERLGNDRVEGPPFTVGWCGPGETEKKVRWRGADALVLFNRFYRLDIDVDSIKLAGGNPYSTSEESHLPLRWISLLAGRLQCDLAATTGIHDGRDAIKQILAGATAVQVCSTLYQNGLEQIGVIIDQMQEWMLAHNYQRLDDFRGQLSQAKSANPDEHERMQYIKALVGIE